MRHDPNVPFRGQVALVNIAPNTVDTVLVMSTFDCGDDLLLAEATALLGQLRYLPTHTNSTTCASQYNSAQC